MKFKTVLYVSSWDAMVFWINIEDLVYLYLEHVCILIKNSNQGLKVISCFSFVGLCYTVTLNVLCLSMFTVKILNK